MTTLLILNILTIASILFLVIKLFFCRSKLIILQQRNVDFQSTIDSIEKQLVDCNNENNNLKEKNNALINDINIKDYEIRQLHAKIDEIKNNSNEAQKQMLTQFQNLANNILKSPYLVFIGGASKYFILLQFEIWYLKLNTDKIEPCVRII